VFSGSSLLFGIAPGAGGSASGAILLCATDGASARKPDGADGKITSCMV
jgi:hypothetical protein